MKEILPYLLGFAAWLVAIRLILCLVQVGRWEDSDDRRN